MTQPPKKETSRNNKIGTLKCHAFLIFLNLANLKTFKK